MGAKRNERMAARNGFERKNGPDENGDHGGRWERNARLQRGGGIGMPKLRAVIAAAPFFGVATLFRVLFCAHAAGGNCGFGPLHRARMHVGRQTHRPQNDCDKRRRYDPFAQHRL